MVRWSQMMWSKRWPLNLVYDAVLSKETLFLWVSVSESPAHTWNWWHVWRNKRPIYRSFGTIFSLAVPFVAAQCVVSFLLAKHCENIFHSFTNSFLSVMLSCAFACRNACHKGRNIYFWEGWNPKLFNKSFSSVWRWAVPMRRHIRKLKRDGVE